MNKIIISIILSMMITMLLSMFVYATIPSDIHFKDDYDQPDGAVGVSNETGFYYTIYGDMAVVDKILVITDVDGAEDGGRIGFDTNASPSGYLYFQLNHTVISGAPYNARFHSDCTAVTGKTTAGNCGGEDYLLTSTWNTNKINAPSDTGLTYSDGVFREILTVYNWSSDKAQTCLYNGTCSSWLSVGGYDSGKDITNVIFQSGGGQTGVMSYGHFATFSATDYNMQYNAFEEILPLNITTVYGLACDDLPDATLLLPGGATCITNVTTGTYNFTTDAACDGKIYGSSSSVVDVTTAYTDGTVCDTTGGTAHICTIDPSQALIPNTAYVYLGCNDTTNNVLNSTGAITNDLSGLGGVGIPEALSVSDGCEAIITDGTLEVHLE